MARFSNIIQAAAAVMGYAGGYVHSEDGPHYTVRVNDGTDRQEDVTVSVIGSGDLAPADHYGNEPMTAGISAPAAPDWSHNPWIGDDGRML